MTDSSPHPPGCDCADRWRHAVDAALARKARARALRAQMAQARAYGVQMRNANRLRAARLRQELREGGGDD